nr:MAG TPA: hypothetical protein [Caudoviricetes sp.]
MPLIFNYLNVLISSKGTKLETNFLKGDSPPIFLLILNNNE